MTDPTPPGTGDYGQQQQPGYGQPPAGPPPGYAQPPPGYGQPPAGPPPGYGQAPPPGYGAPGYGAPQYGVPMGGAPYKGQALGLPPTGANSLASQWKRLLARFIDFIIVAIPAAILFAVLATGGAMRDAYAGNMYSGKLLLPAVLGIAIGAAYEIYFISSKGATPGKSVLGMRVANISDGKNPDMRAAVVRWAVVGLPRFVPRAGGPFGFLDAIWCLWDANRQCIHDKPAKTVVINTQ